MITNYGTHTFRILALIYEIIWPRNIQWCLNGRVVIGIIVALCTDPRYEHFDP